MKASELRIGNLIQNGSIVNKVWLLASSTVNGIDSEQEHFPFTPIPLTEEWLLKFGFDNDQVLLVRGLIVKYSFTYQIIELIRFERLIDFKIEFVHELQNLYFALTGEELTLKNEQR